MSFVSLWFVTPPRQEDCILEYILPTKPKRTDSVSWGLLEFSRMKRELENLLGRKVDLLTKKSIEQSHNWIRQREILETAQVIYVAG
ncbi:MAG: hypothetical protein ACKN9A_17535 [Microcystis aeruginosa]